MLNRLTKAIIIVCGLVVFEVGLLSLISYYNKEVFDCNKKLTLGEPLVKNQSQYELVSGIVPHHDLAKELLDKFWQTISVRDKPETIVILSPDHFGSGNLDNQNTLITLEQEAVELRGIKVASSFLTKLNDQKFSFNTSAIELDHGIGNLLVYIKKYLPEAQILPVLIPANSERSNIIDLIQSLVPEKNLMVIASTDFSHYLPLSAAELHDVMSQRVIINFEVTEFEKLDVDCWQCVYGARLFSSLKGLEDYEIIGSGNSAEIVNQPTADSTTSYFSAIFGRGKFAQPVQPQAKTMIFVGDLMFDRGVKDLMKKNSVAYPLAKVKLLFRGLDYVSANLEGPIVKDPQPTKIDSYNFNFSAEVVPVIKDANINLITLANNHILNRGQVGFKETKEFLTAGQIDYSGDAFKCGPDMALIKDEFIFLGLNKTFPTSCTDEEIAKTIKILKQQYPDNFLAVNIHWGVEYQIQNSVGQANLAHLLIDNGADLIIGHHPHVVQNIEKYKNKLIFYSLGNFVFDQYFSDQTQQGLAVGLELWPNKQIYRLFPLDIKLSQPKLISVQESNDFLRDLAGKSSVNLKEEIINGVINIQ